MAAGMGSESQGARNYLKVFETHLTMFLVLGSMSI